MEAITHHDDGWADWESEPKLNPAIGAPYSFLEMPLAESLDIWDRSIASARKFGPLAGYIVAGHFYNLLADSDHAKEPPAIAWLTAKRKFRTTWLDEWIRADRSHTLEYAKAAQQMLLTADLFSLWLCCDCPVDATDASILGRLGDEAADGFAACAVSVCVAGMHDFRIGLEASRRGVVVDRAGRTVSVQRLADVASG